MKTLTPEQAALYLTIAETAMRLLRDDVPFEEVKDIFGKQGFHDDYNNTYTYSRHEINNLASRISFSRTKDGLSQSVSRISISGGYMLGISKQDLEKRLGLQRASNYVTFNIDPATFIDFHYHAGMDLVSCYPVNVYLSFFKDQEYSNIDPRADSEAKYLGTVTMLRAYMTPEEKMQRAQRVPQCRSRQPAPRSGLWLPKIPHDVPGADYFLSKDMRAQRVKKGQPMLSVGISPPSEEARVLWTWVGK
ncbi:hypothetical protein [Cupriavidus sp. UME77]|uniref:hypothetical protein n=1 Tax=Cupriavidus sp. UME77 TaxID=1862321 RepID=UPI001600931A|nr:hypothetical protein [Cupriavidus sp. UME77]MBB1631789.1 hypothetical protein [Cupriavidus sp. UME77]